ncbi:hypothetical protein GEMRC1_003883 [Eukaryota sp. GEM-RC1]
MDTISNVKTAKRVRSAILIQTKWRNYYAKRHHPTPRNFKFSQELKYSEKPAEKPSWKSRGPLTQRSRAKQRSITQEKDDDNQNLIDLISDGSVQMIDGQICPTDEPEIKVINDPVIVPQLETEYLEGSLCSLSKKHDVTQSEMNSNHILRSLEKMEVKDQLSQQRHRIAEQNLEKITKIKNMSIQKFNDFKIWRWDYSKSTRSEIQDQVKTQKSQEYERKKKIASRLRSQELQGLQKVNHSRAGRSYLIRQDYNQMKKTLSSDSTASRSETNQVKKPTSSLSKQKSKKSDLLAFTSAHAKISFQMTRWSEKAKRFKLPWKSLRIRRKSRKNVLKSHWRSGNVYSRIWSEKRMIF